jgi:hypothetical protein
MLPKRTIHRIFVRDANVLDHLPPISSPLTYFPGAVIRRAYAVEQAQSALSGRSTGGGVVLLMGNRNSRR